MDEKNLERKLKKFLNSPSNRIMRGVSRLTVFSGICYAGWWGIAGYINYTREVSATPIIATGIIVAGYTASKIQGHLYNKAAEKDFKNNYTNP